MENKIPTAEEFLIKENLPTDILSGDDINYAMIEFAKLHVEVALKEASENADMDNEYYQSLQEGTSGGIDIESILNAYPLTNIK